MKAELFGLSGKVAIVTGGNGGIGLGMARGLAKAGAAIAIVGRNEQKSAAAVAELKQAGAKAISVAADVTDKAAVDAMAERVARDLGRIDILVNNAGMSIRKPPHVLDIAEWNTVIATNLTSAFVCSQAVYPAMKAAGGGKVINIGSMMSIFGASFASAYAASKGGIVQFTRACAVAWAADNIQVNAVLPGWIDTDLTKRARQEVDCLHDRVLARTPAARCGRPGSGPGSSRPGAACPRPARSATARFRPRVPAAGSAAGARRPPARTPRSPATPATPTSRSCRRPATAPASTASPCPPGC